MHRRVPREWESLNFLDPERILVGLRRIAQEMPLQELRYQTASLRSHATRKYGEGRQAALFCYGMSCVLGAKVAFAQEEQADHDVVARYEKAGVLNYVPVQLKEFVPTFVNPRASLQAELDKLGKYANGQDLVVAFHLNREITMHPSELIFPKGAVVEIWFYGATERTQTRWIIMGNLLSPNAVYREFTYPAAA